MKYKIICVGKMKKSPYEEIILELQKRMHDKILIIEVECRDGRFTASQRKDKEAELMDAHIEPVDYIVAMDLQGKLLSSLDFSHFLSQRAHHYRCMAFLIGGADGLSPVLLKKAHFSLSFGPNTWPHLFARIMLVEQLYRAEQIEKGHPYHDKDPSC